MLPMIATSRLLKSWAMPPASLPTASSFWLRRSSLSRRLRLVMSRQVVCRISWSSLGIAGQQYLDGKDLAVGTPVIPLEPVAAVAQGDAHHLFGLLVGQATVGLKFGRKLGGMGLQKLLAGSVAQHPDGGLIAVHERSVRDDQVGVVGALEEVPIIVMSPALETNGGGGLSGRHSTAFPRHTLLQTRSAKPLSVVILFRHRSNPLEHG